MPPKGKKSLSLSQKPARAPPTKKSKLEKDGAQRSINTYFTTSSTQGTKPAVDGFDKERPPLSTLGPSDANVSRLQASGKAGAKMPDRSMQKPLGILSQGIMPNPGGSDGSAAAAQARSISQSAQQTTVFTAGSKRSRDLLHKVSQHASTSSPAPSACPGPSITPATLAKTSRPTLSCCPGPAGSSHASPMASPRAASARLEQHATFGLGAESFEPTLSQECHDLLFDDEDDSLLSPPAPEKGGACKKRCRSFPPSRPGISQSRAHSPAAPPSRLGSGVGVAKERARSGGGVAVKVRAGAVQSGKTQELKEIYSHLQSIVEGGEEGCAAQQAAPGGGDEERTGSEAAAHGSAGVGGRGEAGSAGASIEGEQGLPPTARDRAGATRDAEEDEAVWEGVRGFQHGMARPPLSMLSDAARVGEREKAKQAAAAPTERGAGSSQGLSARLAAACGRGGGKSSTEARRHGAKAKEGGEGGDQRDGGARGDKGGKVAAAVGMDDLLAALSKEQVKVAASAPAAAPAVHRADSSQQGGGAGSERRAGTSASAVARDREAEGGTRGGAGGGGGRGGAGAGRGGVEAPPEFEALLEELLQEGADPRAEEVEDRGERQAAHRDEGAAAMEEGAASTGAGEVGAGEGSGAKADTGRECEAEEVGSVAAAGPGAVKEGEAAAEEGEMHAPGSDQAREEQAEREAGGEEVAGESTAWEGAARCRVMGVRWEEDGGGRRRQVLELVEEGSREARQVALEGDWLGTEVEVGERVVVIGDGDFRPAGTVHGPGGGGGEAQGGGSMLVVHPEELVSATKVGEAFDCCRKGVLGERVKDAEMKAAALVGNMVHAVFQHALQSREWAAPALAARAEKALKDNALELRAAEVEEAEGRARLAELLPQVGAWCDAFLGAGAKEEAKAPRVQFGLRREEVGCGVAGVLDIEEMVHSGKYGLKGQVDASVEVLTHGAGAGGGGGGQRALMPLEIKSGREHMSHHAQVVLYCRLMRERYPHADPPTSDRGLLVYLKGARTHGVAVAPRELGHILMARNRMARHLAAGSLPEVLREGHKCGRCFKVGVCALYHAAVEQGSAASFGAQEAFAEHTAHLSPAHLAFFRKWEYAVGMEEAEERRKRHLVWTATGPEREAAGGCFARMALRPRGEGAGEQGKVRVGAGSPAAGDGQGTAVERVFVRFDSDAAFERQFGFARAGLQQLAIGVGDRVTVREEGGSATAGCGTVVEVTAGEVRVEVKRDLDEEGRGGGGGRRVLWRVDKEEFGGQAAKARLNLARLFMVKGGDEKRRRLVVDLEAPSFDAEGRGGAGGAGVAGSGLNEEQVAAVGQILRARDYVLLHGMPGTGKTTTIAWAVKAAVAQGRRVLVTAFTNSAVDQLLRKIGALGVDLLRVAPSPAAVHPELRPLLLQPAALDRLASARVVGTTCLNAHSAALRTARFDLCIVDEASQVTLPHCLAPLRLASAFVLVGDHQQLPPLVTNREARNIMGTSLFKRLYEAHAPAVAELDAQYRMSSTIMGLANELVYQNRLRCGSPSVASHRVHVAPLPAGSGTLPAWVEEVVRPEATLVLVDTSGSACAEEKDGGPHNSGEAVAVALLVARACRGGVPESDVGVITPYRAQIKAIRVQLENAGVPGVEVSTVDSYQGRDKDCIIMSFVHNNEDGKVGELLADWRRVNVAVTRAKGKLVLVGCAETLQHNETLGRMIAHARRTGTVVSLGPNAFAQEGGCPSWAASALARTPSKAAIDSDSRNLVFDKGQ